MATIVREGRLAVTLGIVLAAHAPGALAQSAPAPQGVPENAVTRVSDHAYAIIGSAGPVDFYARTLGATPIADSWPGIYRDRLKKEDKRPAPHQTA